MFDRNSFDEHSHSHSIWILVILLLFLILILLWFFFPKSSSNYLIIGGQEFLNYQNGTFSSLSSTFDFKNYEFQVYQEQTKIGDFKVNRGNEQQVGTFYDSNQSFPMYGSTIMIGIPKSAQVIPFHLLELSDMDRSQISPLLPLQSKTIFGQKIEIDWNHDQNMETLYFVTSYDPDHVTSTVFSAILIKENETVQLIYQNQGPYPESGPFEEYAPLALIQFSKEKQPHLIVEIDYGILNSYFIIDQRNGQYEVSYSQS